MNKIGIIWIDDLAGNRKPQQVLTGWVCTSATSVRKVSLNELDSNIKYITNIKPNRFGFLGLNRFPCIKAAKFLGVALSNIAIDLNLPDELDKKLPVLFTICQLMADRLSVNYHISTSDDEFELSKAIHAKLTPVHQLQKQRVEMASSIELENAINNSSQKVQANVMFENLARENHTSIVSCRFPRSPYAVTLLNLIYPSSSDYQEDYSFAEKIIGIQDGESECTGYETVQQLKELAKTKCGFVQFAILGRVSRLSDYYPLGREVGKQISRNWATIPEIIDMAGYLKIKIGKAFITDGAKLEFAPQIPTESQTFMSYVNGLINETLWTAVRRTGKQQSCSPIASYIAAYDRIMCRAKATKLIEQDFRMAGFSAGVIRFVIVDSDKQDNTRLTNAMIHENMLPQFNCL